MQVRNQKVEKVHRALRDFLRPKLRPGFAFDATPFFIGIDDRNIADKLDDVVGAACRATSGDLAYDAVVPELRAKLKKAVQPDGTAKSETPKGEVDPDIVDKVLTLLEARLTHSELMAVKQILLNPSKDKSSYDPGAMTAEDAKNAKVAYDARFPGAARIRAEPAMTPAPQRQSPSTSPSDYFRRFPSAQRIGL